MVTRYPLTMTDDAWLTPFPPRDLLGDESFTGIKEAVTVLDFWRFALGDLQMNNARGYLAEFLVGRALGIKKLRRIEWDAFDLLWEGIRIEVKASARLQAWEQRIPSTIAFGGLKGTPWTPRDGEDPAGKQFNADVYVFCAHLEEEHSKYDQLDVSQWSFYVVPRAALVEYGAEKIRLKTVLMLSGGKTAWESLPDAVRSAATIDKTAASSSARKQQTESRPAASEDRA
jgi:hypothetical protein